MAVGCADKAPTGQSTDADTASPQAACPTTFSYQTDTSPDEVFLAGEFNDWEASSLPMEEVLPGLWSITTDLLPGTYPYKMVEYTQWSQGGAELWTCDASSPLIHCEEGTAADLQWSHDCQLGESSCNSMLVVEDCSIPRLEVDQITVDRDAGSIDLSIRFVRAIGGAEPDTLTAMVNEVEVPVSAVDGDMFHVELSDMSAGRHHIELVAMDSEALSTEALSVPIWMDEWSWDEAVIYHAMIDRFANGRTRNDSTEGTSIPITDYAGGDLAGLEASLPYLDDLGVNTLWLSNPQAGPEGPWAGSCNATYAGYHGFWPTDWDRIDPHLGDEAELESLITAAHALNMRVLIDWVGNHLHQDHPALETWPQSAIHDQEICNEYGPDGQLNWDRIPESCWFTSYLPDLDQTDPMVLQTSIDKALEWAEHYKLDGLRVDAAKHMPHSVSWNLASKVARKLEHRGSGFDFTLMGETFDGADAINAYIGENQLDGQFDFPLYWKIREAFVYDSASLRDVVMTASTMKDRYPGGRMSTFLGNLDVGRFVTDSAEGTDSVCPDGEIRQAYPPSFANPYDRLMLAWTLLFTQPGIPLIYYGDEMGLPGYNDPDNRQPLWWTADVTTGDADAVAEGLDADPARVLRGVKALAKARRDHPVLATGETTEWWADPMDEPSLYAYSRSNDEDGVLVVISRWNDAATLSNNLEFAGLPAGALYEDVLTGETFQADGDTLTFDIPAMSARLLLPQSRSSY